MVYNACFWKKIEEVSESDEYDVARCLLLSSKK